MSESVREVRGLVNRLADTLLKRVTVSVDTHTANSEMVVFIYSLFCVCFIDILMDEFLFYAGDEIAGSTIIQYGGSVKPDNVKEIMSMPDIDGCLVGGASLTADSFAKIINYKA